MSVLANSLNSFFKPALALGLVAGAALVGLSGAQAQARSNSADAARDYDRHAEYRRGWGVERIDCPVATLKRQVKTRLPKGWRSQHHSPLDKVEIVGPGPARDRLALVCDYGEAGTIKRYVAAHRQCWTVGTHFLCDAGHDRRPRRGDVFSQGAGWLKRSGSPWDLDSGREINNRRSDIYLARYANGRHVLRPMNGARIWRPGPNRATGYARCAAGGETLYRIRLADLPKGSELCIQTAEGRIGKIRVIQNKPSGDSRLKMKFKVWEDRWADLR